MTSREQEVDAIIYAKAEQDAAADAIQEMTHYQALGVGMAAFCQAFCDAMSTEDVDGQKRFERFEILALLHTALGGVR